MASRLLGYSSALRSAKFDSPREHVKKSKLQELETQEFRAGLLKEQIAYEPKMITPEEVNPITKRPVPLNVELLQHKPLRLSKTHGHEVANIKFRGYDEKALIRASEFAARAAYFLGIPCSPVQKLKTERRLYTVIRSPFAQAKSKENFFRTTYHRKVQAYDALPEIVDLWISYINKHKFDDVHYTAQASTQEGLDFAEKLDKLLPADMEMPAAYADALLDPVATKVKELLKSNTFKDLV